MHCLKKVFVFVIFIAPCSRNAYTSKTLLLWLNIYDNANNGRQKGQTSDKFCGQRVLVQVDIQTSKITMAIASVHFVMTKSKIQVIR